VARTRTRVTHVDNAAVHAGCNPRTLYRYVSNGLLTPIRVRGSKALYIDLDEVDALELQPRSRVRPHFGSFGPNARPTEVLDVLPLDKPRKGR
jgi:hypothetical protein